MRRILNNQLKLGGTDIGSVEIDISGRDEIPQLLLGLQHIYVNKPVWNEVQKILWSVVPVNTNADKGRPGMDIWKIFVLGTLRLICNWDYDKLQEIANNHFTLRQLLGHGYFDMHEKYARQTLNENIALLTPEILEEINVVIVKAGLADRGISRTSALYARCDSFVLETDVHFPTDVNLLWDTIRKVVQLTHKACNNAEIRGWRQANYWLKNAKKNFRAVQLQHERNKESSDYKHAVTVYLFIARKLFERAMEVLPAIGLHSPLIAMSIDYFLKKGLMFAEQLENRVMKGIKTPHSEKCFSVFEPHTEWISKGKAGTPQELGLRVCIVEEKHGFILHHMVMEKETDVDIAVPIIDAAKHYFPNLHGCSFDKGFHSPENQEKLSKIVPVVILPKKGKLDQAREQIENGKEFKKLRKNHAAVESGINALENHGLDRVLDMGIDGFKRYVALAIVARNLQLIGRNIQDKKLAKLEIKSKYKKAA